ncbi:hypothetical protein V1527DRAFT_501657 [Lipomyces starkeyi]
MRRPVSPDATIVGTNINVRKSSLDYGAFHYLYDDDLKNMIAIEVAVSQSYKSLQEAISWWVWGRTLSSGHCDGSYGRASWYKAYEIASTPIDFFQRSWVEAKIRGSIWDAAIARVEKKRRFLRSLVADWRICPIFKLNS